jgi:predicted lipoprotein with Yx(FWY)xxD motif
MFRLIRKSAFLGILVISTLLLAACGTASAQPASTTAAPAQTQPPAAAPATSSSQSGQGPIVIVSNTPLGNILTGSNGMTLYTFQNDKPDESTCTAGCAQKWPPLTVAQGITPTAGAGVTGALGVFQRADGTYQVTINQMPLYFYFGDTQLGDTNGQGLLGKWYVVDPAGNQITSAQPSTSPASPTAAPAQTQPPAAAPTTSSSQSAQGPVVVVKNTSLGNILTSSDGMTLYIFTTDKPDQTSCTDGCAQVWPPLTVPQGVTLTAGPGVTGTLGVFQRPDGSYQVTINKMPVYLYSGDAQPGDTSGQGLFGKWYVVDPAGNSITSTPSSSGSGGY